MSTKYIPGEELSAPNGQPILGRLFVHSLNYSLHNRYVSNVTVIAKYIPLGEHCLGVTEVYSIVFSDPIHVDIRTHEDAFASEYTDPNTGELRWERGELWIKQVSGLEKFSNSSFLKRFGCQESCYCETIGEDYLPNHFRFVDGEQLINIMTIDDPLVTPTPGYSLIDNTEPAQVLKFPNLVEIDAH